MQAIQTEYKGYLFRSRLEARWAVFFDCLDIKWEYEPEGIVLSDGTWYLPDFFLLDFHCFFEVKRRGIKGTAEGEQAIKKISDGAGGSWAGIIAFGDPMDDDMHIFCSDTNDSGGGAYDNPVTIGLDLRTRKPYLLAYRGGGDRDFWTGFGEEMTAIPMVTGCRKNACALGTYHAQLRARRARFEHRSGA